MGGGETAPVVTVGPEELEEAASCVGAAVNPKGSAVKDLAAGRLAVLEGDVSMAETSGLPAALPRV